MDRRTLLATGAAVTLASAIRPAAAQSAPAGWRQFEITTRVTLQDAPGAAQLWVPMAQDAPGYQTVLHQHWSGTGNTQITSDAKYAAPILRATWDGDGDKTVELVQIVATTGRSGANPARPITQAERAFWLTPTDSVPNDGIVKQTADRITIGIAQPRDRLRALYNWVVDNTSRNPETPGCGFGDVKGMLETGNLSGKCADINGLMTALARAAGFPARDIYGIRAGAGRHTPWLGATGVITKAQHCRCEVYLDGAGWFPLDPADVRKVVLEQNLPLTNPHVIALRDYLFGAWEGNWVGYNSATDIALPGAAANQEPNFAFLMYPCAFTTTGQANCLDPAHFQYEITARELT